MSEEGQRFGLSRVLVAPVCLNLLAGMRSRSEAWSRPADPFDSVADLVGVATGGALARLLAPGPDVAPAALTPGVRS